MDHFGIGTGVIGASETYFRSARRTGRTTSLIDSLKNGDRVVCVNAQEASRLRQLFKERGLDVECMSCDPARPDDAFRRGSSQGRTLFEHCWVEQYYRLALARAEKDIDAFQEKLSGYGEAHRETLRQAQERAR